MYFYIRGISPAEIVDDRRALPKRSGAATASSADTEQGTRKAASAVRDITRGVQRGEMVKLTWDGAPLSWTGKPTSAIPTRVANHLFDPYYRSLCRGLHERRSPQRRRSPPHGIPHRTSPPREPSSRALTSDDFVRGTVHSRQKMRVRGVLDRPLA